MRNEENKAKNGVKSEAKSGEEPPKGYIHVRARRGQATDSHSLAERVKEYYSHFNNHTSSVSSDQFILFLKKKRERKISYIYQAHN